MTDDSRSEITAKRPPLPLGEQAPIAQPPIPSSPAPSAPASSANVTAAGRAAQPSQAISVGPVAGPSTNPLSPAVSDQPPPKRKGLRLWRRKGTAFTTADVTAGELVSEEEEARRRVPSWLFSLVAHLVLLLALALIPVADIVSGPLTLFVGVASSDGVDEFELLPSDDAAGGDPDSMETEYFEPQMASAELLQQLTLPEVVSLDANDSVSPDAVLESIPFGIKNGLIGRQGAMKQALLSRFGGSTETEAAVEAGLAWLAKQQSSNGSWSLVGPYDAGGVNENTTAATALALNAFLGAGYSHKDGKYKEQVKLGLAYLVQRQDKDGFFCLREPARQQMYAQAIASICVIEAFAMGGDYKLGQAAQKAIRFAEWSQSKLRGWRYEPKEDADLSVTGWFVMALITGKMAGLEVDDDKLYSVNDFLDSVSHEQQSRYSYTDFQPASLSMTAEGLLCRIYLGWPKSQPALLAAIRDDFLPTVPDAGDPEFSVYYWYYATQVMHHVGGEPWRQWNRSMKSVLPALQEKTGPEKGSWNPRRDAYGAAGGRLYTTCLHLYCLEVYYRHLAIYDPRGTGKVK